MRLAYFYNNSPPTASCSFPELVIWEFRASKTRKASLSLRELMRGLQQAEDRMRS